MNVRVFDVRSHDRLTAEGMAVLGSELEAIIADLMERPGGCPDYYQFWEAEDENGLPKLLVAINPDIPNLNEEGFIAEVLERLKSNPQGGRLTAQLWRQTGMLHVVRAEPRLTAGKKLLSISRDLRC